MPTIKNAPDGERTPIDGTEAVPLSNSGSTLDWWTSISTIKNYVVEITDALYSAFNHNHSDSNEGGAVAHSVLTGAGTSLHVPAYSSDSSQYLNGKGEWTTPAGMGNVYDSDVIMQDITTNNADSDSHGFLLKLSMDTTKYLRADGSWQSPPAGGSVYDSDILFSDITTNNSSTSQHGFLPKLSGDSTEFLNGDGEWETPAGGSGVTDAEYIVSASHAGLSEEVVIPGLASSSDIAGAGGAGTSEEYDTATTGITFDNAVTTLDSNTTALSHLYIKLTGDTNIHRGTKAWSPAGAFDARAKIGVGNTAVDAQAFGLFIGDNASADSNAIFIRIVDTPATPIKQIQAYSYASGTPTQRGATWTWTGNVVYFRLTRDGSNNVSFYFSSDGLAWQLVATVSFTFTPSRIGFRLDMSNSSDTIEAYIDWLRTSV